MKTSENAVDLARVMREDRPGSASQEEFFFFRFRSMDMNRHLDDEDVDGLIGEWAPGIRMSGISIDLVKLRAVALYHLDCLRERYETIQDDEEHDLR